MDITQQCHFKHLSHLSFNVNKKFQIITYDNCVVNINCDDNEIFGFFLNIDIKVNYTHFKTNCQKIIIKALASCLV